MLEHKYSEVISKRSSQNIELNNTNCERKPKYIKFFRNNITQERFVKNDVQIMKFKRDKQINHFFSKYYSDSYSLIECGFDFEITTKVSDVLRIVNRNIKKIGENLLGYIWLVDKGEERGNMHFHLVLAFNKLDFRGKKLPHQLQFKFNGNKIHSSFVVSKEKLKKYLLKKKIYYIGKRKRVFGKSREFI